MRRSKAPSGSRRAGLAARSDRMMVFQEFDQLLPWKTVLENVLFPLLAGAPRGRAEEHARALIDKVNLTNSRRLSAHCRAA